MITAVQVLLAMLAIACIQAAPAVSVLACCGIYAAQHLHSSIDEARFMGALLLLATVGVGLGLVDWLIS